MGIRVPPDGPIPARVMLVGEHPGPHEIEKGRPFVGPSGFELDKMLGEAGLSRAACFVTNVAREMPPTSLADFIYVTKAKGVPKNLPSKYTKLRNKFVTREIHEGVELLRREIQAVKPNVIVPMGNAALWALTGNWGITKWRGSMLLGAEDIAPGCKIIPTIHPAAVLHEWSYRSAVVYDFKRIRRFQNGEPYPKPKWDFLIGPSYDQCCDTLWRVLNLVRKGSARLSFDLETRFGHIDCAGLSWSLTQAICIPFLRGDSSDYWAPEQEANIIHLLYLILTHHNAEVVGQNILYDCQYTWRHWHFVPQVSQDCMISQHSIFSDLPKALAFQASMYCDYYVYWKDEGKHKNPEIGDRSHWYYNCEDVVYTDECGQVEQAIVEKLNLKEVHTTQQKLFWPVLAAMKEGVLVDQDKRKELDEEVSHHIGLRQQFLRDVLGHDLNPQSPKQMHTLFYKDLGLPIQWTRGKKGVPSRPTLDDDALSKLAIKEPLVKPLLNCIADLRTLGIFRSTFLRAELDADGRMRTAYNIGGSASGKSAPKTYRLSSSENAFGSGANLQNIPSEKSKSLGKAKARGGIAGLGDPYQFPNIRSMFIPDPGYTFFDGDLDRADLQVVAWEADEPLLKAALKMGADIHLMNTYLIEGKEPPPLEELIETHPKYWDHRGPRSHFREFSKVFCHGTNYGGKSRTMAANTGRLVHEIDLAQKRWFGRNPGIARWHKRTEQQVAKHRFVENKFGYRWYIFDRLDEVLPEALAWIPQSTVSNVINKIWQNVFDSAVWEDMMILMQVHDSLPGQFLTSKRAECLSLLDKCSKVVVPYDDPLVIPFSVKTSEVSWGECK